MSFTYLRESAGEYSAVCSTEISQKEIAAKPASPPINELGMATNPPSFDRPTAEVDKKSFIRQGIDFYLDEFDDRQLAKALCCCTEIRAETSTIGA